MHPMPDPAPERRPPLLPSHLVWPAFVVFLLALSVGMGIAAVVAARSDGGARLVPTEQLPPQPGPAVDAPAR